MNRLSPPSTGSAYTMSAWVSPVCGRAFTMLSIFTASTRFSAGTGSPVNGDSWCGVGEGVAAAGFACPPPRSASSRPATKPATMTTAATAMTALFRVHLIAPDRPRLRDTSRAAAPPQYHPDAHERPDHTAKGR